MKPFSDRSGHLAEEGACEIVRAGHEGWRVDQREFRDVSTTGRSGWIWSAMQVASHKSPQRQSHFCNRLVPYQGQACEVFSPYLVMKS